MKFRNSTIAACITACIIAVGDFQPSAKFEESAVTVISCEPGSKAECAGYDWGKLSKHFGGQLQ